MKKQSIVVLSLFSLVGCSSMIDKINNMDATVVSFPTKERYTVTCLETAASRRDYFLEKTEHIGSVDRYTLRKLGGKQTATLDIEGNGNSTSITLLYDRRDRTTSDDLEGILGYCKKTLVKNVLY